jgi:hypothetical protein
MLIGTYSIVSRYVTTHTIKPTAHLAHLVFTDTQTIA